jgi:hypothetical protein
MNVRLLYGVFKVWQKLREPQRPIFDEFVSVFSDRFGRLFLALLLAYFLWAGIPVLIGVSAALF